MMNYNQVEGILYNYKTIKASIENNKLRLANLELEDGAKGISYGEPSSNTNKISNPVESAVIRNVERQERLKRRIAIDTNTIRMIDNALEVLSKTEKTIIKMFYIEDLNWCYVADEVGYSEGWCKAKRNSIINRMLFMINGIPLGE